MFFIKKMGVPWIICLYCAIIIELLQEILRK